MNRLYKEVSPVRADPIFNELRQTVPLAYTTKMANGQFG